MPKGDSNATASKKSKKATGDGLPSFDARALSELTEKIEHKFKKTTPKSKYEQADAAKALKNGSSTARDKSETGRGTKRDSQGNAKDSGRGNSFGASKSTKINGRAGSDREVLLQEILALGGTEEDLDLVADADSNDEGLTENEKHAKTPDQSFRNDLAKFVAGLGIESNLALDADEPENQAEETWEDASAGESDMGEEHPEGSEPISEDEGEDEPAAQVTTPREPIRSSATSSKDPNRLIFEARADWHAAALPSLPAPVDDSTPPREIVAQIKDYAISLLEADANLYASKHLSASSSHRFLSTIMSSGTLSDKVSALTLVVQESPVHTTKSFESLLTLAKKRSRGQAVTALGALKDLLGVGVVLPADRRLRTFAMQPGLLGTLEKYPLSSWNSGQRLPGNITKAHLISWAFEDWLKESYFDMLKVLEGWCNDEVEYARSRAVTYVYELLKEKPEQESNLLRLLVNKLGDPEKKIASRTSYLLLQLQTSHPLMKPIIIRSIESELLLRPGQSQHAKYYAINTLNQTILSGKEEAVAQKLLSIYFELFVTLLKKPNEQKPVNAPVVNRKGQLQGGGAPMGKKAKAKATKEEEAKQASEEATEKMISAVLSGVNRAFPFSKADDVTLEKHMDTLFRITHSSNFNTSIQALMLIEQLATSKNIAVDRFYRTLYESLLDPRLVNSSKHALYLNLLFRALRSDLNVKRVKAFAKRLVQTITLHQPSFVCGVMYLLKELEGTFPGLKMLLNDPEESDEIEEEIYRDVIDDDEVQHNEIMHPDRAEISKRRGHVYDGRKRDPEHSNADKSCLWEIIPFLAHYHPSVSMFAERLVKDEKMPPKPDLASHTLIHFLDRFVYRNAKAAAGTTKGGSIMQPLAGGDSKGILLSNKAARAGQQPVNSESFWRKKAEDVAVDEVFFHRYFNQIGKTKQAGPKKTTASRSADDSDVGEDEDEDEIWQALVDSRPEVEGPSDDDDSDLEMMDLEDSDAESDKEVIAADVDDDQEEDNDDFDAGSLSEGSGGIFSDDDDALLDSDDEAPSEIDELFAKELEHAQPKKADEGGEETSRQKRRKLKNLPTFASAEDYADMLADENEDM
ncbi:CBF-domain-containing protein [Coleophoma cylindrospora]|uniref:CBF-domain-containing protein n=1 Tax=Coleophoma cylindrospora TaxID=1849047 RepID=A0A3D8QWV9_9HELO|nr:CBF-domain-containing protein [Coleophoma cylindrospora]